MRYFTKNWYYASQQTFLHNNLVPDERASVCSEALYQELYEKKLNEEIVFFQQVHDKSTADILQRVAQPFLNANEMEQSQYDTLMDQATKADGLKGAFDKDKVERDFAHCVEGTIQRYQDNLPREILSRVADIRILGLDVATADVCERIKAYCQKKDLQTQQAVHAYKDYLDSISARLPKRLREEFFGLHDARIDAVRRDGNDVYIEIGKGSFLREICFVECEICQMEDLVGAEWLYEELYIIDGGYEVGALAFQTSQSDDPLREFWLRAKDIRIQLDEEAERAARETMERWMVKGLATPVASDNLVKP